MQPFPAPETPPNVVVLALGACSTLLLLDPLQKELEAQLVEKTLVFYKYARTCLIFTLFNLCECAMFHEACVRVCMIIISPYLLKTLARHVCMCVCMLWCMQSICYIYLSYLPRFFLWVLSLFYLFIYLFSTLVFLFFLLSFLLLLLLCRQAGVNSDPVIATIFSNFVDMLAAILFMDTNVACLTRIFKVSDLLMLLCGSDVMICMFLCLCARYHLLTMGCMFKVFNGVYGTHL